jgi:hypothetical protein
MAIVQPHPSDKLGDKGHARLHCVFACDDLTPSQSILIDSLGKVGIANTAPLDTLSIGGTLFVNSTVKAGSLQATPIGSTTKASGAFTTLTANGTTFTSATASSNTTTGGVIITGGVGIGGAIYAGSIQATPVGSTTKASGAFTTLTATGAATLTLNTASTSTTTGTLVVTGGVGISGDIYAGSIQATPVGSSTKSTGAFTTLTSTNGTTFTANTTSSSTTTGTVVITGGVGISGAIYNGGDITTSGNIYVSNNNIQIGNVVTPTNVTANNGGITLKGATNKTILWDNTSNNWTLSENINIPTGKTYKINNVDILSSTALASTVLSSSLTSVGTIATGTWNATTIAIAKGGTAITTYAAGDILYSSATNVLSKLAKGTDGQVLKLATGLPAWGTDNDTNTWDANSKTVAGYVAAPGAVNDYVWRTDSSGNPAWRSAGQTTDIYQSITDDTSTDATYYPSFVVATTGALVGRVSSTKLTFNPNTGRLNTIILGATTGSFSGTVSAVTGTFSGTVSADTFTETSDKRLKSDIKIIENALEKVNQLNGYTFEKSGKRTTGIIAQELQKVLPEAVQGEELEDSYLSVSYGNIVGLLIEAIKEQDKKITKLENLIIKQI